MQQVTVTCTLTVEDLVARDAGPPAQDWLTAGGHTDLVVAWQDCKRPDWMLWLLKALDVDRRLLVQIACALVRRTPLADGRTVWDLLTFKRSRQAVVAAEGWVEGKVTDGEIIAAVSAARAAERAAAEAAAEADDSADAVADARAAAAAAAVAEAAAAEAAVAAAAAYAAEAAATYAARAAQANIVREYVTLTDAQNNYIARPGVSNWQEVENNL